MLKTIAALHAGLSNAQNFFEGAEDISYADARRCVRDMRLALSRMATGIKRRDKQDAQPQPEAHAALLIVDRIERAITVKDGSAGVSACNDLRKLGHEHSWRDF